MNPQKFQVFPVPVDEVYADHFRVPQEHRKDVNGKPIYEGQVCRVRHGKKTVYAIARGMPDTTLRYVRMDEKLRDLLGIKLHDHVDLAFEPCSWFGQFMWAWSSSNPSYRISARIALVSLFLGLLSLVISIIPLCR